MKLEINEASAKIRTGDPVDDEEDHALDVWAGLIPLKLKAGKLIDDALLKEEIKIPEDIISYAANCD